MHGLLSYQNMTSHNIYIISLSSSKMNNKMHNIYIHMYKSVSDRLFSTGKATLYLKSRVRLAITNRLF